jgi:serpin B
MFARAQRKRWSDTRGRSRSRRRLRKERSRPLRVESLESRDLLTGAPFVGPLQFGAAPPAGHLVPTPPATTGNTNSAAPVLTPAQIAAETAAGQSINALGLDLYNTLQTAAGGSGNMILSPLSISTALVMAYAGANGETAAQMASVLHLSGSQASTAQEFGTLLADLNSAGQGNYALSVADALWGQQGMQFLSQFLNTMQTAYGGAFNQADFAHDPNAALQTINDWVAQQTDGKIQNLFSDQSINQYTKLVLANALYFQGNWASGFNTALTSNANFTLNSGVTEQVSTMHQTNSYSYMQSDGFQVVELPYAGGRLAMDIMLPTASGAAGLSVSQIPSDLDSWLSGLSRQDVSVSLPKFTLTTQFDLAQPLQTLGMTDAFQRSADFSGMTNQTSLQIADVVHKAFVDVGESGTQAAAATGVSIMHISAISADPTQPIAFNADHPFLYMIRDTQSGSVLFMGQEADPLSDAGDPSAPAIVPSASTPQPERLPPPPVTSTVVWIGPLPFPGTHSRSPAVPLLPNPTLFTLAANMPPATDGAAGALSGAAVPASAAASSATPSASSTPATTFIASSVGQPDQSHTAAVDAVMSDEADVDDSVGDNNVNPHALSAIASVARFSTTAPIC